ncbi:hypothetical protein ACHAW6_003997 [Cyclotella cf. meneghiniana]
METAHGQNTPAPVSCDNRFAEEQDEHVTISDANPHNARPPMSDISRDEYHPHFSLIGKNCESKVAKALEQAVDDNSPIPVSQGMYFAKDADRGYSSKLERFSSVELAGEDHVPLPITQLIGAKKTKSHEALTDIQGHGFINSSIPILDGIARLITDQSISTNAHNPTHRTNNDTSESLNFEPSTTANAPHNRQANPSLDSSSQESEDVCLPTQPVFTDPDIIIPEAFLVTNDASGVDVLSGEFTDSMIPSAEVVLPAKYSLIIAGKNIHVSALAAIFILVSLVIGFTVGVRLRNDDSISLITQTISNHSSSASIKDDIEKNVLRQNTTFSELDKYDSRNKALDWILLEDPMPVNSSFSKPYQRYIMALLRYEFNPISELDLPDWLSKKHECEWHGVSCLDGKITELELGEFLPLDCSNFGRTSSIKFLWYSPSIGLNLTGSLPPEVSRLDFLRRLVLKDNFIEGTLPPEISDMRTLKTLDLNGNMFRGSVPPTIGNMTELTQLDISHNQFSGSLPSSIGNLTELTQLHISKNEFTGSLPSSIGNLDKLTSLDISENYWLTGTTPSYIGNLSELTYLDISWIQLTGSFPSYIWNLNNLTYLDMSWTTQSSIFNWEVETFNLSRHLNFQFTGTVPSSIWNLNKLNSLSIRGNGFTGSLSSLIGSLTQLNNLWISENQFTGSFPYSIGNLNNLTALDISWNAFNGSLPSSIGNLNNLTFLDVSSNDFTGTDLIKILNNLDGSLSTLNFGSNAFTVNLTDEICSLFQFDASDVCVR